jgi:hypothetical protein
VNPFLEDLYTKLEILERTLKQHGANKAIQERARDARNAINWLQEKMDKEKP